jgi:hypothetical protein
VLSHVIVNTQSPQSRSLLDRYAAQGSRPVAPSLRELEALGLRVVGLPLMHEAELLRHDPHRLADAVFQVIETLNGRPPRARAARERRLAAVVRRE